MIEEDTGASERGDKCNAVEGGGTQQRDTILPSDQFGHSWANVSYGTLGKGLNVKTERERSVSTK